MEKSRLDRAFLSGFLIRNISLLLSSTFSVLMVGILDGEEDLDRPLPDERLSERDLRGVDRAVVSITIVSSSCSSSPS